MNGKKKTKQHQLGQYMTTEDVANSMCEYFLTPPNKWIVFDPACGDGTLLEAAAWKLVHSGIPIIDIRLFGFDIDNQMIHKARHRLEQCFQGKLRHVTLCHVDTLLVLSGDVFLQEQRKLLDDVNIIIANPPYGKGVEIKFFEACNTYFADKAELVFLLPISFVDTVNGTQYHVLKGRPLGVTTGHVIVHHTCGANFIKKTQKESLLSVNGFSVLTGVKLYEKGGGSPPQDEQVITTKPYSSEVELPGWLPCLRTGDIQKFAYTKGRLWVQYGNHLAHPKELSRFDGPRIFVRRVPIWACKSLGAAYIEETALCAGDVLIVKHQNNDPKLLKGLCVFLNSPEAAEFIVSQRPSVGHRDSYPKISAKDLVRLLNAKLPDLEELNHLSARFK